MTAKQLEQETGCKIMVRGRGSKRRGTSGGNGTTCNGMTGDNDPTLPQQSVAATMPPEPLHVLVQCDDTENRAALKLRRAVDEVKKLMVPAVRIMFTLLHHASYANFQIFFPRKARMISNANS